MSLTFSWESIGVGIGVLASLLTILGFFEHKWRVLGKNPYVRRIWWWSKNEKILVKIDVIRKYPYFEPDIYKIKELITHIVLKDFKERFSTPPIVGENYIIFSTNKMSSPIKLSFYPDVEGEDEEGELYLTVSVTVLGNLVFVYKESKNYSEIIDLIEQIYDKLEQTYSVKPIFVNNTIIATISDSFEEDWSIKKEIVKGDTVIRTGSKIVMAHSGRLSPLADITKFLVEVG